VRVLLAIIGALLGWRLAQGQDELLAPLLGAFAGYALVELAALRQRIGRLERELRAPSEASLRSAPATPAPQDELEQAAAPQRARREVPIHSEVTQERTQQASGGVRHVLLSGLSEYVTGGNTLVWVGVLILFVGVAFLLSYIAERADVPLQLRLLGVALGGALLLVLGLGLRRRRPGYALTLQGGGVGILYLTAFAALRLYSLLPPATTLAALVVLAALSAALAVMQSSRALAVLAVTGGFLAPLLAPAGEERLVMLFSYYTVLNVSILAIAWYRSWRELNFVGFLFTFAIATGWGVLRYRGDLLASTEPFLALFFLLYLAIAILFAFRQPPELRGYVDGTLVFGTPMAAFGYQSAMLHDRPLALAASALAVAVLYFLLSGLLGRRFRASHHLLAEAFLALGVVFLTVAVPLALDSRSSAATWALQSAALIWIGCRQLRPVGRALGALLALGSGMLLWRHLDLPSDALPVINGVFLTGATVGIAAMFGAVTLCRYADRLLAYESLMRPLLFLWGLGWWLYTGVLEINRHTPDPYGMSAALVFMTVTAFAASQISRFTPLGVARVTALCLLPVLSLFAVAALIEVYHPLAEGGWLAWPLGFAGFYLICRRHEDALARPLAQALHILSAWLLTWLASWELAFNIGRIAGGRGSWHAIGWALVPVLVLAGLPRVLPHVPWPLRRHRQTYLRYVSGGIAVYLAGWSIVTSLMLPGDAYPFAFLPVLNPLDLAAALVLAALWCYWLELKAARQALESHPEHAALASSGASVEQGVPQQPGRGGGRMLERCLPPGLAVLAFIWLNTALLRTVHVWTGIAFDLDTMVRSMIVQTVLSIFWTVLALAAMLLATRRHSRILWLAGAGLLAAVVVKLFVVDLSHIGTLERVVSFVGVGVLILVIGYFSPALPDHSQRRQARER